MKRYLVAGALVVLVVSVAALGQAGDAGVKAALDRVSAPGTPVAASSLSRRDVSVLHSVHATDKARLLGSAGGIGYYLGATDTGATCFMSGPVGDPLRHFTSAGCMRDGGFPSRELPILDDSAFQTRMEGTTRSFFLIGLGGIAADGVASVGVVDSNGEYVSTPVHGNIYWMRPARDVEVRELVAKDRAGRIVYSFPLTR